MIDSPIFLLTVIAGATALAFLLERCVVCSPSGASPGILVGLPGYAVGTYLGFSVAYLQRAHGVGLQRPRDYLFSSAPELARVGRIRCLF